MGGDCDGVALSAFSLDVKDLLFSLLRKCLSGVFGDCIDVLGEVSFQENVGHSSGVFVQNSFMPNCTPW